MAHLHLHARSGVSGDMFVGALLAVSGKKAFLQRELKKLGLANYRVAIKPVVKNGVRAMKFDVHTGHEHVHRHLSDINTIIDASELQPDVKTLAKSIFLTLGRAEAKAHRMPLQQVHFHEVGAIDSIIDIVSAAILIRALDITSTSYDVLTDGRGKVKIGHGVVTVPVPAVREILHDFPITIVNTPNELITPTGAAILATLRAEHVEFFNGVKGKKGVGAGTKTLQHPNVLHTTVYVDAAIEKKYVIETNIDDMNPELFPYVVDRCMQLGAVEANVQSCIMKKNRIGFLLSVLCDEKRKNALVDMLFEETTTFGMRIRPVRRAMLDRRMQTVKTKHGAVRVKVGSRNGKRVTTKVEYEDAKKCAMEGGISLKRIYAETTHQFNKHTR